MGAFEELPEECITAILSRTTAVDAVRLSVVSKAFRSAADSDDVWNRFLPSDSYFMDAIISHSPPNSITKKALFLALSDRPIIIDNAQKSFQLDRKTGKNCCMLSARSLTFHWGGNEEYWIGVYDSRFPEVVELNDVYNMNIRGTINTIALSPNTQYVAYLVFKMIDLSILGLVGHPVEFLVRVESGHSNAINPHYGNATVCLYRNVKGRAHKYNKVVGLQLVVGLQRSSVRSDKWFEIEMGEIFNSGLEDEVEMSVFIEIKDGNWDTRLLLEGIEVRPK